MKRITFAALLAFAKQHAGQRFPTLARGRPFVVDVIDERIVCYPESGEPYWLETDTQVPHFNKTNSLRRSGYPEKLFTNSYFVGLVDAMLSGTKPITPDRRSKKPRPQLPSPRFDKEVRRLRQAPDTAPPAGQQVPVKKKVSNWQVLRVAAVKAWVLKHSGDKCACCFESAPFKDDAGLPFLEVHHVIPLANKGPDTISNAVALCPNCHRACHHSRDRKKIVALLYKRYPRLKKRH